MAMNSFDVTVNVTETEAFIMVLEDFKQMFHMCEEILSLYGQYSIVLIPADYQKVKSIKKELSTIQEKYRNECTR
jgi:hypothetical protein